MRLYLYIGDCAPSHKDLSYSPLFPTQPQTKSKGKMESIEEKNLELGCETGTQKKKLGEANQDDSLNRIEDQSREGEN